MDIEIAWAAVNFTASIGLAAAGAAAFAMWRWPRTLQPFTPGLALALACVLWFLAVDEGVELHDRVGHWLWKQHGVLAPGPIHHVDDLILLGYLIAAAICGLLLLPSLLRHPRVLAGLSLGAALLAFSTLSDAIAPERTWVHLIEESVEAVAATIIAVTLWTSWRGTSTPTNQVIAGATLAAER